MYLSIIIPVYNKQDHIEDCLDSILKNQNTNSEYFQVICVNDGSTDDSLSKLEKYQSLYENIIIINQSNKGASAARNSGIKNADGKYVWFIDTDDLIPSNIFNDLFRVMNNDYDLLTFSMIDLLPPFKVQKSAEEDEGLNIDFTDEGIIPSGYTWANIAKLQIIKDNNVLFNEGITYGEDTLFWITVGAYCNSIRRINKPLYYYKHTSGSIMEKTTELEYKIKQSSDMLESSNELLKLLQSTEIKNPHVKSRIIDIMMTYTVLVLRKSYYIQNHYSDKAFQNIYPLPINIRMKYLFRNYELNWLSIFGLVFS